MKHAHVTTHATSNERNWLSSLPLLLGMVIAFSACMKQHLGKPPATASEQIARLASAAPGDSLEIRITVSKNGVPERKYEQNNLKQMALAVHNNPDGSIKEEMTFEYDQRGALKAARIRNGGTYLYNHDPNGRIVGYKFYETGNTNAPPTRSGPYRYDSVALLTSAHHYDRNGRLDSSTHYSYHANGQVASVEKYVYRNGKRLITRIRLDNRSNESQVAAWKRLAALFPQPELPWEILTLLSCRIEEGRLMPDDIWVDGRIITAENMIFNHDALLTGKTLIYPYDPQSNTRPGETLAINFTKIQY